MLSTDALCRDSCHVSAGLLLHHISEGYRQNLSEKYLSRNTEHDIVSTRHPDLELLSQHTLDNCHRKVQSACVSVTL